MVLISRFRSSRDTAARCSVRLRGCVQVQRLVPLNITSNCDYLLKFDYRMNN